ncbi:MAG: TerB family tellurite resistance protein [Mariprofundaceae bacterium]|nr:TerB family tellurite resistance protein [Mariprofundaceae bacterium]
MVNVIRTQGRLDSQQFRAAINVLRERFWLSREAAEALFDSAVQAQQETPRFEQLALHIRKCFTRYELTRLLQDIRGIAIANGKPEKGDEGPISHIACLLGVPASICSEARPSRASA